MEGMCVRFDNRNVGFIWSPSGVPNEEQRQLAVPPGQRGFETFFVSILPKMANLYWFAQKWESSPFVALMYEPNGTEQLESFLIDQPLFHNASACLLRPGVLPELAHWLYDDWIDLLGFRAEGEKQAAVIATRLFSAHGDAYHDVIEREVEFCFFCVDGFSWELYCHNHDVIQAVADHVAPIPHVTVEWCRLRDRRL